MQRSGEVVLAVLQAKRRVAALALMEDPSEAVVNDQILWVAVEMDGAEVLECVRVADRQSQRAD